MTEVETVTKVITGQGRLYRWRKAGKMRFYHLVKPGGGAPYCGGAGAATVPEWGEIAIPCPEQRCRRCTTLALRHHHIVSDEGSYRERSVDAARPPLRQHIHAGLLRDDHWTSHPYTFTTARGFNKWSRLRQSLGYTVQWRFCNEDDQRHYHNRQLGPRTRKEDVGPTGHPKHASTFHEDEATDGR